MRYFLGGCTARRQRRASRARPNAASPGKWENRFVRFITQHGVVALVVAAVLSGCSGGEQQEQEQVFRPADATRIGNVRPVMPGWTWPQNPEKPVSSGSQTEDLSTNPLLVELKRQTADIVSLREAGHKWRDDNKLANLTANVLASAAEAHEADGSVERLLPRVGREYVDASPRTRGSTASATRPGSSGRKRTGAGTEVTYHWRRGNLVVEAHVDCFGVCPGDVDAAARAWVDAIDEEARSAGG